MTSDTRLVGAFATVCAAFVLVLPAAAGAQPPSLAFGACHATQVVARVPGLQCATLDVPFDRADPDIGDIALAVQRVPAKGTRVGVLVLLAGGPGQPALPVFEGFLAPLARDRALAGYELVAFDQRGTGQSGSISCPEVESIKLTPSAYIGLCGSSLGLTRAFYSSQESVEDLDALRQGLGGTPLSLFAVSYGGRVAGMYAREHPQGVARMVLDSPTPVNGSDPLDSQRLHALRRVLDEGICGAGACRLFSSNVYADLTRLVARLHRHPLHARIYMARGRLRSVSVTEAEVLSLLTPLDISPGVRELAPAAIVAAVHGDVAPLARLTQALHPTVPGSTLSSEFTGTAAPLGPLGPLGLLDGEPWTAEVPEGETELSLELFAATYCPENMLPWSAESSLAGRPAMLRAWLAALPATATAPFAPATVLTSWALTMCLDWPATPAAPPSPDGVSATPTLILSGDDDLRTPYEQDLIVAAGYSDAQLLRIPGTGHSTVTTDRTGCAKRAMIEFLTTGHAPASCRPSKEPQTLPLPPASLADLEPVRAPTRLVGRVGAAVAITHEVLYGHSLFSGGGLRGGYWQLHAGKVIVHNLVDVPGVAISGSIGQRAVAHFTVHGRLNGTLTQRGLNLTGRIGGAPIKLQLVAT